MDIILGIAPIPYADEEVIELVEGTMEEDIVPGLTPVKFGDLTLIQKLFIILPILDNEYLDFFGIDMFKSAEQAYKDENLKSLDEGTVMADGGNNRRDWNGEDGRRAGVYDDIATDGGSDSGSIGDTAGSAASFMIGNAGKLLAIIGVLCAGVLGFILISGGGHLALLGDMFGSETSQAGNAAGGIGESMGYRINQFSKTVQCFGDAGCIREWRLNNTRKPGSRDVGETYELKVKGPDAFGPGNNFDVAFQPKNSNIPVFFVLQNTRHQLKGIDAENIYYRVRITDPQFTSASKQQCGTEWIELNKYGDEDIDGTNMLNPGESAEPVNWQSGEHDVSLEKCGLLQPSAGESYDLLLQVKYDYSSQSTLQLEAMSSKYMREEGIRRESKRSKTADTPVQSYINTRSPMIYTDTQNSGTISVPQQVRVGVSTDESGIEYKLSEPIKFRFEDSGLTEKIEDSDCDLETVKGQPDTFKLKGGKDSAKGRILELQKENWFDQRSNAVQASCTFQLKDPAQISETGETLRMSVESDYTLKMSQDRTSFDIRNSLCSTENCPMLDPITSYSTLKEVLDTDLDEDKPSSEMYTKKEYALCNGPDDAQDGCSILKNGFNDRSSLANNVTVNENELAVHTNVLNESQFMKCDTRKSYPNDYGSFDEDDLEEATNNEKKKLEFEDDDWDLDKIEDGVKKCFGSEKTA